MAPLFKSPTQAKQLACSCHPSKNHPKQVILCYGWAGGDLNSQALRHMLLRHACLPFHHLPGGRNYQLPTSNHQLRIICLNHCWEVGCWQLFTTLYIMDWHLGNRISANIDERGGNVSQLNLHVYRLENLF